MFVALMWSMFVCKDDDIVKRVDMNDFEFACRVPCRLMVMSITVRYIVLVCEAMLPSPFSSLVCVCVSFPGAAGWPLLEVTCSTR